jgi:hypothetical protein
MKLKKVTALLLATSMVLSSVSVASFADELIFEEEYSVTEVSDEDETYFGDETVDEVATTEEDTGFEDEALFGDETIDDEASDDTVVEDVFVEDLADEGSDLAIEEENADVFEAIENAEDTSTAYADVEFAITGDMSYDKEYDGESHGLDKSKAGVDKIRFRHESLEPAGADYDKMVWLEDSPTFKHVGNYPVQFQVQILNSAGEWVWPSAITGDGNDTQYVNIKPVVATATLNNKAFKVGDAVPTLTIADYTFEGLKGDETADKKFTISNAATINSTNYELLEWNGAQWVAVSDWTTVISDGKFKKAGRYTLTYISASDSFVETLLEGQAVADYTLQLKGGEFTVSDGSQKEITVFWPEDKVYTGEDIEYAPSLNGYTFTYSDSSIKKAKNVGTYAIEIVGAKEDATGNTVTVTNPTHEWTITKAKAYAFVTMSPKSFEYGIKDPTVVLNADSVKLYKKKDRTAPAAGASNLWGTAKDLATGTPVFETTYTQYDPVYTFDGTDTSKAWYYVRYKSGLESKNLEIVVADDDKDGHLNGFQLTPAYVKVVPDNITATYAQDPVEPTYKIENVNKDSGAASALEHDINNNKVILSVYTIDNATADTQIARFEAEKVTATKVDTYKYGWKLEDATPNSGATRNFVAYGSDKKYDGTAATNSIIDVSRKYVVNEGEFTLKFSDYEGVYDGKPHGIVVEPDPLPSNVTVYYSTAAMSAPASGSKVPTGTGVQAEPITYTDVTDPFEVVYYYVVSDGLGSGMNGYNKVIIKDDNKAAAEAVEKQIEDATTKDAEGKYDPEKVKAARAAYDALTNDQKALVDPYHVKALQDAEAAIAAQDAADAKAVEDMIAALPAPDQVTEADKDAIEAAQNAYDALSDEAKAMVSKGAKDKLDADVKALKGEEDADKKAAKAVEDLIDALPAAEEATADTKPAADAAKAAFDALTDAQKALVPDEKVQKLNDVKAAADKAAEEEEKAKEEIKAFDEAVAAVKAAKNGVDGKAAAEKAKEAYDNLSPEAKALLTDGEIAAYEATQKAYQKDNTFEAGEGVFRVLSNGEVTYVKPLHPEQTWFVVPNQVKKRGFMYKVIKVSTKAFMGCTNAKKIKIGKNVQTMGSYVFKNTPVMGKLIFLTSKLGTGKVKNTFTAGGKDKGAKLTVVCPNGLTSKYQPLFTSEGGLNPKATFTEGN